MPRTKSSARWLRRHFDDEFVKRARADGFRSRAVYKLQEMDRRDRLFHPGMVVLDLGAAPGGWSQYAVSRVGTQGRVLAVDLLTIEPISGVEVIQGDIAETAVLDLLQATLKTRQADLVISDLAPSISGIAATDQARFIGLAECVLEVASRTLVSGGGLLLKVYQGEAQEFVTRAMRSRFDKTAVRKPSASRAHSPEIYFLGRGFSGA